MCILPGVTSVVPVDEVGYWGHASRAVDTRSPAHLAVTSSSLTHKDLPDQVGGKHFLGREKNPKGVRRPRREEERPRPRSRMVCVRPPQASAPR